MLTMMVFWDDDRKKPRVEKSLRSRKHEGMEEATIGVDVDRLVDVLSKQTELVDKQSERIEKLTEALTKALERTPQESQPQIIYVDKNSNVSSGKPMCVEEDDDLPKLHDRDVQVINTQGIEIADGQVGDKKTEGADISDRVAKLKKLRGKKS